jgi:hypothetical protein
MSGDTQRSVDIKEEVAMQKMPHEASRERIPSAWEVFCSAGGYPLLHPPESERLRRN